MVARIMDNSNLATDQITMGKLLFLVIIVFSIVVLAFYTINIPDVSQRAMIYWVLGVTSLAVWGVSKGVTKVKGIDFPNPIIFEADSMLGAVTRKKYAVFLLGSLIVGIWVFFSVASAPTLSILQAPKFQVIEVTTEVSAVLTFMSSLMEDFFFWGVVLSLIYGIVYIMSRSYYISLGAAGFGAPLTFTLFHTLVYGTTNLPASTSIFVMGVLFSALVLITRNLTFPIIVHGLNNISLNVFSATGGIYGIEWLGYTLIFALTLMAIYVWFRWRR
jgi:hypothetical protein